MDVGSDFNHTIIAQRIKELLLISNEDHLIGIYNRIDCCFDFLQNLLYLLRHFLSDFLLRNFLYNFLNRKFRNFWNFFNL